MKNVIIAILFACGLGGGFFLGFVWLLLFPFIAISFGYLLMKNKESFFTEPKRLHSLDRLKAYDFYKPKKVKYQFDDSITIIEKEKKPEVPRVLSLKI